MPFLPGIVLMWNYFKLGVVVSAAMVFPAISSDGSAGSLEEGVPPHEER